MLKLKKMQPGAVEVVCNGYSSIILFYNTTCKHIPAVLAFFSHSFWLLQEKKERRDVKKPG